MKEALKDYDSVAVDIYERYVIQLQTQKDKKKGGLKNFWATKRNLDDWVYFFKKVAKSGIYIDGENVTIGSNGISLNYQAYKNLVLIKYPEAIFDVQLVRQDDVFSFTKKNGVVDYNHEISGPFDNKPVIGGYCIIKIRSGEFIEIMSLQDLEHVRKTARTDSIWAEWTEEMYLKTLLKRACKRHFRDVTEALDLEDNNNYDLSFATQIIEKVEACKTMEQLDKIRADNQEAMQQMYTENGSALKQVTRAMGKKEDQLYKSDLEDQLTECETVELLDDIYQSHEKRINQLKAADRNYLTQIYCSAKQYFMDSKYA
jgi:hypothetical protein